MADRTLGLAGLAAALGLALIPIGDTEAAPGVVLSMDASPLITVAQEGRRFHHHSKRGQSAYCLRQNYWWFYRPYTTAQEDFRRCEPYFHYPESAYGRQGARAEPYYK